MGNSWPAGHHSLLYRAFSPLLSRQQHCGVFHVAKAYETKDRLNALLFHAAPLQPGNTSFACAEAGPKWLDPLPSSIWWAVLPCAMPGCTQVRQCLSLTHICRNLSTGISLQPHPGYVYICIFTALQMNRKYGSFKSDAVTRKWQTWDINTAARLSAWGATTLCITTCSWSEQAHPSLLLGRHYCSKSKKTCVSWTSGNYRHLRHTGCCRCYCPCLSAFTPKAGSSCWLTHHQLPCYSHWGRRKSACRMACEVWLQIPVST